MRLNVLHDTEEHPSQKKQLSVGLAVSDCTKNGIILILVVLKLLTVGILLYNMSTCS